MFSDALIIRNKSLFKVEHYGRVRTPVRSERIYCIKSTNINPVKLKLRCWVPGSALSIAQQLKILCSRIVSKLT